MVRVTGMVTVTVTVTGRDLVATQGQQCSQNVDELKRGSWESNVGSRFDQSYLGLTRFQIRV